MIDYAEAAKTYDHTRKPDEAVVDIMGRRGVFAAGNAVLDFGCGTGNYLLEISRSYDCDLFGLEPSEAMRKLARAKNPSLRIESGDHAAVPFGNRSFDFIYMTDVIHHVPDLGVLFRTLAMRSSPKGSICVVTESWRQIESRWYNASFVWLEKGAAEC